MPAEEELPADLQALCRRNALELTEQDWDEDFAKLLKALETSLGLRATPLAGSARSAGAKWVLAAMGGVGALILLAGYAASNRSPSPRIDNQTVVTPNPHISHTFRGGVKTPRRCRFSTGHGRLSFLEWALSG
jgi:hypothetical protein